METLTKENFWNELQEKYPEGMKIFCDWIDKYKKENNWYFLFAARETDNDRNEISKIWQHVVPDRNHPSFKEAEKAEKEYTRNRVIKFHDLPFAMQIGIWLQFEYEMCPHAKKPPFYWRHAKKQIITFIKDLNQEATD